MRVSFNSSGEQWTCASHSINRSSDVGVCQPGHGPDAGELVPNGSFEHWIASAKGHWSIRRGTFGVPIRRFRCAGPSMSCSLPR